MSETKLWQSRAGQFQDIYKAEVERELTTLSKRELEIVMRLVDYQLFRLGPEALQSPHRAQELSGAASALNALAGYLNAAYVQRVTSDAETEGDDSHE